MDSIDREMLDILIDSIPLYPPLKPGGDVTIREMYPELTETELEYVMTLYSGTMQKG